MEGIEDLQKQITELKEMLEHVPKQIESLIEKVDAARKDIADEAKYTRSHIYEARAR